MDCGIVVGDWCEQWLGDVGCGGDYCDCIGYCQYVGFVQIVEQCEY